MYSASPRYRYAPSDTAGSLDSYPTLPYCYSRYGNRRGRDVRHLHLVNLIISLDHMVETMFPMHHHQRIAVLIHKKEYAVPVNHLFIPRWPLSSMMPPETFSNILRHGKFSRSCICLRGFNHQLHICSLLKLVVNIEDFIFQVNILQSHPAEHRNLQPRMKKNINRFIIFAVDIVIMNKLENFLIAS